MTVAKVFYACHIMVMGRFAGVAELVDALGLGPSEGILVEVQVLSPAPV